MDWKWQSFGTGWRRTSFVAEGYDDRAGGGGQHCDEWIYVVSDGESALTLEVYSNRWPSGESKPAYGADLTLHVPWPAGDEAEEEIRRGRLGGECCFTEPNRCWTPHSTSLGARDFFREHGVDQFEQPEAFWNALREKAAELIVIVKQERAQVEHLRQCPTCAGRGVVEIKEEDGGR
jgi:hypothetical protein